MLKNQVGCISFRNKRGAIYKTKPLFKKATHIKTLQIVAIEIAIKHIKENLKL